MKPKKYILYSQGLLTGFHERAISCCVPFGVQVVIGERIWNLSLGKASDFRAWNPGMRFFLPGLSFSSSVPCKNHATSGPVPGVRSDLVALRGSGCVCLRPRKYTDTAVKTGTAVSASFRSEGWDAMLYGTLSRRSFLYYLPEGAFGTSKEPHGLRHLRIERSSHSQGSGATVAAKPAVFQSHASLVPDATF